MTGQVLSRTRIPLHRNGIGTPVAMILGSCLSLQFGAALAVALFPIAGVLGTTTLRLAFAALILVVAIRPRVGGWTTAQWRAAGAYGVALAAMNTAFYAAIDRIPLGTAVAIEFLGPLGLAAILSRRRLDLVWVAVAPCGMGILGAESLFGLAHLDPVGVAFACIAGLCWAGYILTSARPRCPGTADSPSGWSSPLSPWHRWASAARPSRCPTRPPWLSPSGQRYSRR